jgi:hypothetical protein
VVFIVGAVFFTGFALGRHSGGGNGWHHRGHGEMSEMGPRFAPLMPGMRPGGPMGPDRPEMGPGMRPESPPQSPPPAPPTPRP